MIAVTKASCEIAFFVLIRMKKYSFEQSKLSILSLMFIKAEMTNSFDYEDLIDLFSKEKNKTK